MKKNISINLQGIIFHIEEDGYEVLSRYLAEVKAHFASYRGHADIVADIEGRIAELFGARLSPLQQVITLADVEAMMAKMGRVSDFAAETDEDDEAAETAGSTSTGSTFGSTGPAAPKTPFNVGTEPDGSPKRLYRDMAHRKIAGVAAGIAQYFTINPLWVRLGFLLLGVPGLFHIGSDNDFNIRLGGWPALLYIVLWIVLPKRYDAPQPDDTVLSSGPLAGRRLFRDTDTAKIGGVGSGLAAYLNLDVTLVRVLLLAGLFAGGFTFFLYIILWIVMPEAKTVSEKMQMRGDAVTLSGIDSNLRSSAFTDETGATPNRPLGAYVEGAARGLRPAVSFVGSFIRIAVGALLTIMGFGFLLSLIVSLGVALGMLPSSEHVIFGDVPINVLLSGVPLWGVLAGFLAFAIPSLSLLLGGLSLLLGRSLTTRSVRMSLLGLWLLSIVGVTMAGVRQSHEFQRSADVDQLETYQMLKTPVLLLDARHVDRSWEQHVDVSFAALDSGRSVQVTRTLSAQGATEEAARQNALTTIDYTIAAKGDSSLVFDDHFSFRAGASYRGQDLALTIRLPRDRTFRISESFARLIGNDGFVNDNQPEEPEQHRYRLRGNKLECIECPSEQTDEDNDDDSDVNINIDSDGNNDDADSDDDSDSGIDGAPSFATDLESYGSGRRTFEENDFNQVSVLGRYRVVVRHGDKFRIEAAGDDEALRDLRVERHGNELRISPRRSSLWGGGWTRKAGNVLVRVEMPALEGVQLAGAVRADVSGFPRQERLKVEQAGASHLRLAGTYGTLDMDLAGACRTTASGTADNLDLDAAGACELAAAGLAASTADIDLAGMCKTRLQVNERLKGDAVGASLIEYSGTASSTDVDVSGPSRVKRVK